MNKRIDKSVNEISRRNEVIELITELANQIINFDNNLTMERIIEQARYIRNLYDSLGREKAEVYNIGILKEIEKRIDKHLVKQSVVVGESGEDIFYESLGQIEYHFKDGYSLVVQSSAMVKKNVNNFIQNLYVLSPDRTKHSHRVIHYIPEYIPKEDYHSFIENFKNIKAYYEYHTMKDRKWNGKKFCPVVEMNINFRDWLLLDKPYFDDVINDTGKKRR